MSPDVIEESTFVGSSYGVGMDLAEDEQRFATFRDRVLVLTTYYRVYAEEVIRRMVLEFSEEGIERPRVMPAALGPRYEPDLDQLEDEIRELMKDLLVGKSLEVPSELRALAEKVVKQREERKINLTTWASRLADDVLSLED